MALSSCQHVIQQQQQLLSGASDMEAAVAIFSTESHATAASITMDTSWQSIMNNITHLQNKKGRQLQNKNGEAELDHD